MTHTDGKSDARLSQNTLMLCAPASQAPAWKGSDMSDVRQLFEFARQSREARRNATDAHTATIWQAIVRAYEAELAK